MREVGYVTAHSLVVILQFQAFVHLQKCYCIPSGMKGMVAKRILTNIYILSVELFCIKLLSMMRLFHHLQIGVCIS